eukprot:12573617-Alexandrium_andersonii.AAC.1
MRPSASCWRPGSSPRAPSLPAWTRATSSPASARSCRPPCRPSSRPPNRAPSVSFWPRSARPQRKAPVGLASCVGRS